ncbi:hypothetical protein CHS0354_025610 [Potamilus streckersoni]|uniref:Ig-like domain-containing protein n=1 Tax=Potamilus streckersoni TaxID=2493646 RepID=A0AAE0S1Q8_9BIVA|nr:hypothetical protein CHS0354_025610 [Potamilus streckersoni]
MEDRDFDVSRPKSAIQDETRIPKIDIFRRNVSYSSVVLKCYSFRNFKGTFSWMVNGSLIKHNDKYSPDNDFLSVRHLTDEDRKNLYTCKEPGSKLESDPFRIKICKLRNMC